MSHRLRILSNMQLSSKLVLSGIVCLLALLTLSSIDVSFAHPPAQEPDAGGESEAPVFEASTYIAEDGTSAIYSQETHLDSAYFAAYGSLDGLTVTPTELTLAQDYSSGTYISGVINTPLAFTTDIVPLWGADLPGSTELRLETRLSFDGDAWSEWIENPAAFYPVRDGLRSGNLIWVGSEQVAVQFRVTLRSELSGVSPTLNSITLVFNDTSNGPTDGGIAAQIAEANVASNPNVCPPPKPTVISRTAWGCLEGQNSPRRPPQKADVTHIIIHQAETPNHTKPYQDWAGWVRSVWNYHANVLWWGDVGYNYLIDPEGRIYEGRAGGDDVVGIHDTHNYHSMAIGFLGCYGNCDDPRLSVAEPSQAMLDSAVDLMAWKVGQKGIDPLSSGPYAGLVDVPVIAGGRDVVDTTSPGDNLYHKLPELRTLVAEKADCKPKKPCQVTDIIFDKDMYKVGDTIRLRVKLADFYGDPLSGAEVVVEVEKTPFSTQAENSFPLPEVVGEYEGEYSDTDIAGEYLFRINASGPTGERFAPCSAQKTVPVGAEPPTPEPPTPEPPTPEPPTPEPPNGSTVKVEPDQLVLSPCFLAGTTSIEVQNATGMVAIELEVTYDPAVVWVIDANPNRLGVQVKVGEVFSAGFVGQNEVDTANGRIFFAATLLEGDKIEGDAQLITIDWYVQGIGTSAVILDKVNLIGSKGELIEATLRNGTVVVAGSCLASGSVTLQGRSDHSSVIVTSDTGAQTQTSADGSFTIASNDVLNCRFPGYLSAQAGVGPQLASVEAKGVQPISLGTITLLAGDANDDNQIDIFDLVYIATRYQSADPVVDFNDDGLVDILDLALAANNYNQQGPLTEWQPD